MGSKLIQCLQPYSRFLFISSVICFGLPSDSTSRWTPLPLASDSDYYGSQWTFATKLAPMPGAPRKKRRPQLRSSFCYLTNHSMNPFTIINIYNDIIDANFCYTYSVNRIETQTLPRIKIDPRTKPKVSPSPNNNHPNKVPTTGCNK